MLRRRQRVENLKPLNPVEVIHVARNQSQIISDGCRTNEGIAELHLPLLTQPDRFTDHKV